MCIDQVERKLKIAVVIPCFRVSKQVMAVIAKIPIQVDRIYVVDDACPEGSGYLINASNSDSRVQVIFNLENKGVGGAVMVGYRQAMEDDMDIAVKIDGDGQMDPQLILGFVAPIINGDADYTKGNRFYNLEEIRQMPNIRMFGNAVLSLLNKMSSGYWDIFDPTNGYTAIHVDVLKQLPLNKISERYFFESDLLFRLGTVRAKVIDVPMNAYYGDEESQLKISKVIGEFAISNIKNMGKRIFYNYYLRDMSLASIELLLGLPLLIFGLVFGVYQWHSSVVQGIVTPTGTVMLSVLPIVIGFQLCLSFLAYDIANVPRRRIHKL